MDRTLSSCLAPQRMPVRCGLLLGIRGTGDLMKHARVIVQLTSVTALLLALYSCKNREPPDPSVSSGTPSAQSAAGTTIAPGSTSDGSGTVSGAGNDNGAAVTGSGGVGP